MEKIKVFLLYPWGFPDSPYYKYLLKYPPSGVTYLNNPYRFDVLPPKRKAKVRTLKMLIYKARNFVQIPNIKLKKIRSADLVHCAHCENLSRRPWVVDVENYETFGPVAVKKFMGKALLKKILRMESCKRILAWTEAAAEEIRRELKDKEISEKINVVYPAVKFRGKVSMEKDVINLLFIARYFYDKGGLIILKIFDILTKKYRNVHAYIRSEVPSFLRKKYERNKRLHFLGWLTEDQLMKMYEKTDIFVYPGYTDTFGFSILEAMSFGIPIVTLDGFARKEIVEDGKTGFVIEKKKDVSFYRIGEYERELIKKFCEKVVILIENKRLRKKMSKKCEKVVKLGKFSIKRRNRRLKTIYREALER